MADTDKSLNNLRYNQVTQGLEGFGGGTPQWTPLVLTADGGISQLTGDGTAGPGSGSQTLTLATVNPNVGSFTSANITVDAKGRITAAANGAGGGGITQLTGDVTAGPGSGSQAATLSTVNGNVGSFSYANVTVNAKGLVTAASSGSVGNLTDIGTDGITVTGGTNAVIGAGTSLSQHVADTTHNGYLASTDWNTFNGKQPAGNYSVTVATLTRTNSQSTAAATLFTPAAPGFYKIESYSVTNTIKSGDVLHINLNYTDPITSQSITDYQTITLATNGVSTGGAVGNSAEFFSAASPITISDGGSTFTTGTYNLYIKVVQVV